jgi:hypothetical protein
MRDTESRNWLFVVLLFALVSWLAVVGLGATFVLLWGGMP